MTRQKTPTARGIKFPISRPMFDLREIAYTEHYSLVQHYSTLVLKVRVAITTVVLLAAGYATDAFSVRSTDLPENPVVPTTATLYPFENTQEHFVAVTVAVSDPAEERAVLTGAVANSPDERPVLFGIDDRAIVSFLAGTVVALLFLMELGYEKRFYQVIKAGRTLEGGQSYVSYFREYDTGESWPIHMFFGLAVLFFMAIFLRRAWPRDGDSTGVVLIAICVIPTGMISLAYYKAYRILSILKAPPPG